LKPLNNARLRFGIGDTFNKGSQVNYGVRESGGEEESKTLAERIDRSSKAILAFSAIGIARAMNEFNNT